MTAPATTANAPAIQAALQPCWLSWVGAVTGCLNALGISCDTADVAGFSGYAFRIGVHRELCPSGPTVFDWQTLLQGVWKLGRTTINYCGHECHIGKHINERTLAHSRAAFELAQRETAAGRPCVIWGAYIPEFAVCVGTTDDSYLVDSCRRFMGQPQPPIRWDQLEAPGGLYTLGFPTVTKGLDPAHDRDAIRTATHILAQPDAFRHYAWQSAAYDLWIDAIHAGRITAGFGVGYNAACWAEARKLAATFLGRLADRHASPAQPAIAEAAAAAGQAAAALAEVARIFPFPGGPQAPANQSAAIDPLRQAQSADAATLAALTRALPLMTNQ